MFMLCKIVAWVVKPFVTSPCRCCCNCKGTRVCLGWSLKTWVLNLKLKYYVQQGDNQVCEPCHKYCNGKVAGNKPQMSRKRLSTTAPGSLKLVITETTSLLLAEKHHDDLHAYKFQCTTPSNHRSQVMCKSAHRMPHTQVQLDYVHTVGATFMACCSSWL